ncbi:tetratricopeptide repeat protein [Taklimakanibacter lacteus]|uniref:tetratricopeptide repeat protein n=1 Tax=Taklimakanibacter lacteus TaxID=2268456 RepID=UPI0034D59D0A
MVRLGWASDTGLGVPADPSQAEHWYRKAAASQNLWARYQLSEFLRRKGAHKEALSIVDELAHAGYLPAIYRLSRLLEAGIAIEKNSELSAYYRDHAAAHGHVWAGRERAMAMIKGHMGPSKVIPGCLSLAAVLWRSFQLVARNPTDTRLLR